MIPHDRFVTADDLLAKAVHVIQTILLEKDTYLYKQNALLKKYGIHLFEGRKPQ